MTYCKSGIPYNLRFCKSGSKMLQWDGAMVVDTTAIFECLEHPLLNFFLCVNNNYMIESVLKKKYACIIGQA